MISLSLIIRNANDRTNKQALLMNTDNKSKRLNRLDIKQLQILQGLLQEQNLSRVAAKMGENKGAETGKREQTLATKLAARRIGGTGALGPIVARCL